MIFVTLVIAAMVIVVWITYKIIQVLVLHWPSKPETHIVNHYYRYVQGNEVRIDQATFDRGIPQQIPPQQQIVPHHQHR